MNMALADAILLRWNAWTVEEIKDVILNGKFETNEERIYFLKCLSLSDTEYR